MTKTVLPPLVVLAVCLFTLPLALSALWVKVVTSAAIGAVLALPALRMRGLYLALVTLMAAGAFQILFNAFQFPNGGDGFWGMSRQSAAAIRAPLMVQTDIGYLRYTVVIVALCFGLVALHRVTAPGRAWAGIAGALLAHTLGQLDARSFLASEGILLFALAVVGGAYSWVGAVIAGILYKLLPALLNDFGVSADITLTISDDVLGLIGPNGAGKTTMTNAFSGFAPIAAGKIVIDGMNLLELPRHKRARWGVARSFQKVQIVGDLTVADHLLAVCDAKGVARVARPGLINHALDFVGISDARDTLGDDLNPYQKRMTEIAKCLVSMPKIILLDEPGGGLSEAEMQDLRRIIRQTKDRFGAQIIMVDHDVDLIRDVCTSTAVLDFGKLIAFGPTAEVLQDEAVKTAYLGR